MSAKPLTDLERERNGPRPVAPWVRLAAVGYLILQGIGGLAWWAMLIARPESRSAFLAVDAPDSTLLAFALADVVLFAGGSLASGIGLGAHRVWAWPVLCVHTGAAVYAALYCLTLWFLDSHAWLGGAMMLPSLVGPPLIAWHFRPRGSRPC